MTDHPGLVGQAACFITRRHVFGPFQLRPPTIGLIVNVLRWERHCGRCGHNERRWFAITVPGHAMKRIKRPMPVSRYLILIGQKVPAPEDVPVNTLANPYR